MKPTDTKPSTANTRDTITSGSWREKIDTAIIQLLSISIHSSSEPSWPPHTPEIL